MNQPTRAIVLGVACLLSGGLADFAAAQNDGGTALRGIVTSQEEGKMEGVLVTARRNGATFTVSVISDAQGGYTFPRSYVTPGTYDINLRAVGYDLADRKPVDVTVGTPAVLNLKLQKTNDLPSQLTSVEWLMSMPGGNEQKDKVAYPVGSCVYCHTLERIAKSKHTADEFMTVISRMQTYYFDGSAVGEGRAKGTRNPQATLEAALKTTMWGLDEAKKADLAQFFASINLSGGKTTWPYQLKTLPRPKYQRVIMTQYDLPRKDTVAHDIALGPDGTPWYCDEAGPFIGKLDPKTGHVTEYPLLQPNTNVLRGGRDLDVGRDGVVWFVMRASDGTPIPARFDPKTEQVTPLDIVDHKTFAGENGLQFVQMAPGDKVMIHVAGSSKGPFEYRIDTKTMKVEKVFGWDSVAPGKLPPGRHMTYQSVVDSKSNSYTTDFLGSYIIAIDYKTGVATLHKTPTANALPRRGAIDGQDRFWFSEYSADRIGMFDPRSRTIKEWAMPWRYSSPYTTSSVDKHGHAFGASNTVEALLRLDTKTGQVERLLVPTQFDSKKIMYDATSDHVTLWMANTRTARILKVEELD